jgi:predicted XRE-type DNA-binding protein
MLKIQNSKIKNPLLKQIGGNKEKELKNDSEVINNKKLTLDYLLEFLQNNIKQEIKKQESSQEELSEDEINEPEINNFINLKIDKKKLNEIIDGFDFKRYGVLKTVKGKLKFYSNLSFLSSLSTVINNKFVNYDENRQTNYIKSLKLYVCNTFNKSFYDSNNYKELEKIFNFDKLSVSKNLYNYELSRNEILVISDILHINIFILDMSRDQLFFTGKHFVPYKKNVFFLKKEDGFYEPLNYENNFYIDHDNDFIQYLLENNDKITLYFKNDQCKEFLITNDKIEYYNNFTDKEIKLDIKNKILERRLYNLNKTVEITENEAHEAHEPLINDYTENKNFPEMAIATEIESLSDTEESEDEITSESSEIKIQYNKTELKNMKIDEVILIAKSLHINIEVEVSGKKKKKTKTTLIEEIIKK